MAFDVSLIEALFTHVTLPPRLPSGEDVNDERLAPQLMGLLSETVHRTKKLVGHDFQLQYEKIIASLQASQSLLAPKGLSQDMLRKQFEALQNDDSTAFLFLHIPAQNAGLLIWRQTNDCIVFEAFEASPTPEAVLAAQSALQMNFPGSSVAFPMDEFRKPSFQNNLATFLCRAATENIPRFAARIQKAGVKVIESRGTTNPALITDMLATMLEAFGRPATSDCPLIRKRVYDDCIWSEGAVRPWRRSPAYLVLRVALRRLLWVLFGDQEGRAHYKFLIAATVAVISSLVVGRLSPEQVSFVNAKLARRMAKLELDRQDSLDHCRLLYDRLFKTLAPSFYDLLNQSNQRITSAWNNFKTDSQKRVEKFRSQFAPYAACDLQLFNSRFKLQRILKDFAIPQSGSARPRKTYGDSALGKARSLHNLTRIYAELYDYDSLWQKKSSPATSKSPRQNCIELSAGIRQYVDKLPAAYEGHAEGMSVALLTIMEMWVEMDRAALQSVPLLRQYHHGFPDELLDVLQLWSWDDMQRLLRVHKYLRARGTRVSNSTIFNGPGPESFSSRFFDSCDMMQERLEGIEKMAERRRDAKTQDWKHLTEEYDELSIQLAHTPNCTMRSKELPPFGLEHDDIGCRKCHLEGHLGRMRITVCEHPLPEDAAHAKAVVFELCIDEALCAYRDATWALIQLGYCRPALGSRKPLLLLKEYSGLKNEFSDYQTRSLGLASTARKPFHRTHYRSVKLPVELNEVFVPCGIQYTYYDAKTELYARDVKVISFRHHFRVVTSAQSTLTNMLLDEAFAPGSSKGPASNEVIASQSKIPQSLNVHEFLAIQMLHNGMQRRWLGILQELASSNLNFSSEITAQILDRLFHEVGPGPKSGQLDVHRIVHAVLQDETFCRQLLRQIEDRLAILASNFREHHCMDIMIMLLTRLHCLANDSLAASALRLIECARTITRDWVAALRQEILQSSENETTSSSLKYALWACILCRKTFKVLYARSLGWSDRHGGVALSEHDLITFLTSSLALQDSIKSFAGRMSTAVRSALISDVRMSRSLQAVIRDALELYPQALLAALNCIWPAPSGAPRDFSGVFIPQDISQTAMTMDISSLGRRPQFLQCHVLEGHVLLDGETIGRLPDSFRASSTLQELISNTNLFCFASDLSGMEHVLHTSLKGHQIHVGNIDGVVAIRACFGGRVFQILDRNIFCGHSGFDLPYSLIHDCIHFLDLKSGIIECRKRTSPWKHNSFTWTIDLKSRKAYKGSLHRPTFLVDPYSFYFGFIAGVFRNFEERYHIVVQKPTGFPCVVELPRLELIWFVNRNFLLYCKQLHAEIDPNQDGGTFYGLQSALVVRNECNPSRRSILVPVGDVRIERKGIHISLRIIGQGNYVNFGIDPVLGRLSCTADSRIICWLALLHVLTSFVLPDPLLGRNGTDEALSLLAGYCQPSEPLTKAAYASLKYLASLSPTREWYPVNLRTLQKVRWDDNLTTIIQHEALKDMIDLIIARSDSLAPFYNAQKIGDSRRSAEELAKRAMLRRSRFQCANTYTESLNIAEDFLYEARHEPGGCSTLFEIMSYIRSWPSRLPCTSDMSGVLQSFPNIGGFNNVYENEHSLHKALTADFAIQFGPITSFCKKISKDDTWTLAFTLAPLAFRHDVNMDVFKFWLAFAFFGGLKRLELPVWPVYQQYRKEAHPKVDSIIPLLQHAVLVENADELKSIKFMLNHKQFQMLQASESVRVSALEADIQSTARFLMAQWPIADPSVVGIASRSLDLDKAIAIVGPEFRRLYHNLALSRFLDTAQRVLDEHWCDYHGGLLRTLRVSDMLSRRPTQLVVPSLHRDLLSKPSSKFGIQKSQKRMHTSKSTTLTILSGTRQFKSLQAQLSPEMRELREILNHLSGNTSIVRQKYFDDLVRSLTAYQPKPVSSLLQHKIQDLSATRRQMRAFHEVAQQHYAALHQDLARDDPRCKWLISGGLWPCMSPTALLEALRPAGGTIFGKGMKSEVLGYALSLADRQYAARLEDAVLNNDTRRLHAEQSDAIRRYFSPLEYPEWLLLELECNLRIRQNQVEVALATINPVSGANSVLQMNMGLGKTSMIIPMVSAYLSSSKERLMRIVVPRSLLPQTSVILHERLGRLLGHGLLHIPYSRQTDHSEQTTQAFLALHEHAKSTGSVVLAAPEHLLSFQLCGLQALSDGNIDRARKMVDVQSWLNETSRDLLDESDYLLSPKSGLCFPSGNVSSVDGAPHRWIVSQGLLSMVETHVHALKDTFPHSLDIVHRPGGFPILHFLRNDVEEELLKRLRNSLSSGRESILPLRGWNKADRSLIKKFLSDPLVPEHEAKYLAYKFKEHPDVGKRLLLLRGLLVQRILLLTLKKRFNVQYGIDPKRAPIAVPFISKFTPTELSEFGHPDVCTILLTILAFYYNGLDLEQTQQALINISKADDPVRVYDSFIQNTNIPDTMRDFENINTDDIFQVSTLWKHTRFSTNVINYFLNNFVFPRHSKQYSIKLQTNAFDLPLVPSDQAIIRPNSTGFSGTNDNRDLLPLTCPQVDLPALHHTNAEVLGYLLNSRNRAYRVACDTGGKRLTELGLLTQLKYLGIRTLIDAGAMILEMGNAEVARAWLDVDMKAKAALYFNKQNEAILIYRGGREMPFIISNIGDFSEVLVYIDESHCRGTDLPLSEHCTGALTLGLSLQKDALMQAAMRLRKLGTTQGIMFFAPVEVHQSILDSRTKPREAFVDSADVVQWLLSSTATALEALVPLYWSNGANFVNRAQAAWENWNFLHDSTHTLEFVEKIREKEKTTLNKFYMPRFGSKISQDLKDYVTAPHLKAMLKELNKRRQAFQDTGIAVHASALEEVEQEAQREVEIEIELETIRERQNPPRYQPYSYQGLHPEIESFVKTGRLLPARGGYENAFAALRRSAIGRKYGINECASRSRLFASIEFSRTVWFPDGKPNDSMLRAVQHFLYHPGSGMHPETALLITPEEAEDCLALVRSLKAPAAHIILYAAPVTRKMLHFNNFDFCPVPALPSNFKAPQWLTVELGIIAGRLYFEFDEYQAIKAFLGISDTDDNAEDEEEVDSKETTTQPSGDKSGALLIDGKRKELFATLFTKKPIAFMTEYLTALRKDSEISATPMAYVLSGKPLTAGHSFFAQRITEDVQKKLATMHQSAEDEEQEVDEQFGDDLELLMAGEEGFDDGDDEGDETWYEARVSQDNGDKEKQNGRDTW